MTGTFADINERTLIEATIAFLTAHLGHRISTYTPRGTRYHYTLATIDPGADLVYEPYRRLYWLTGPDTDAFGPAHSIRYVFAAADELTCTQCRVSRAWTDAYTAILAALEALAAPYLSGASAALSGEDHLRDAIAMARLIATLTHD
jgi:hypothetical protein